MKMKEMKEMMKKKKKKEKKKSLFGGKGLFTFYMEIY
jgi:hypothetical protein